MSEASRLITSYFDVIKEYGELSRQKTELYLAILAGESATAFGKPVEFTVTWPEGAPFHKSDEEMRQWCAERLEASRRRGGGPS